MDSVHITALPCLHSEAKGAVHKLFPPKIGVSRPPAQLPNPFCRVSSVSIITTTVSLNEYFFEVYTIFDHHYQYVIMSLIKKYILKHFCQ